MTRHWIATRLAPSLIGALLAAVSARAIGAQRAPAAPDTTLERARVAFERAMPAMNGAQLKVTIVEVTYAPGGFSSPHRHPCGVIGYVIAGSYRSQVKGSAARIYKAGDTFYEGPHDVHMVSGNASTTKPVKFLAYFTCDHETALSVDVPGGE